MKNRSYSISVIELAAFYRRVKEESMSLSEFVDYVGSLQQAAYDDGLAYAWDHLEEDPESGNLTF